MRKKIIIIGAGLAGLSAGIYLQHEDVETQIFEMAPRAGGVCAAWQRNDYRFDGCIQWMVGTKRDEPIYKLYKEVGALTDDTVIYNTDAIDIESRGVMYNLPLEAEQFRKLLHTLSPGDTQLIDSFCDDVDRVRRSALMIGLPSELKTTVKAMVKSRGFLCIAIKYRNKTVGQVVNNFKSDIIREVMKRLMPAEFSALALFLMLGTRLGGNAGYPLGGADGVVRRIEAKYKALGGVISYNSKVDDIIIVGGKAVGVRLNGVSYKSDGVIAACDARYTLKKMLRGQYKHPQLDSMLVNARLFEPIAIVSFGLDRKFGIPFSAACETDKGFESAPGVIEYAYQLRSFDFDKTAAPKDGSSVMVILSAPLGYWIRLKIDNPSAYQLQKERLAESIAAELDMRYPGFKDAIAVVDVATPATFFRLANVYKGSFEGFAPTPEALKVKIKKTICGLKAFCICGQWTTAGGGICTAIADGKTAAKIIKREIRR